ncbi:trypsin alpha-4 [Patella vulgata]|uniref:trypsin alpha-4 n=1 Tax=Patella vulgata TaxID=6465 RepID=UPI00217F914F|nr:trypsin alpha-4 [Patella vulgata]
MRVIGSTCVSVFLVSILCVMVSSYPQKPSDRSLNSVYYSNIGIRNSNNGYRQKRATVGNFNKVMSELSFVMYYMYPALAPYVNSCEAYRNKIFGDFSWKVLVQYCPILQPTCLKTENAKDSSDCFVRDTAEVIEFVCCSGAQTQPPTTTTSTTTATTTTATTTTTTPVTIQTCGISYVAPSGRVVGGVNTTECELPWVVGIKRNGVFICGGTIISSRQVITAAHCVRTNTLYSVEVGKWETNSFNDRYWEEIQVMSKTIEENFDSINLVNDIAILTLSRPITFSLCAQPICLPELGQPLPTQKCTVAGWGTLFLTGPQPAVLQKVDLTVYTSSVCRIRFGESENVVPAGVICADNDGLGGKDACKGDSGGPLMCMVGNKYTLFGIVSSGRGCADAGEAGFYTNIPYYRNWINSQLSILPTK